MQALGLIMIIYIIALAWCFNDWLASLVSHQTLGEGQKAFLQFNLVIAIIIWLIAAF